MNDFRIEFTGPMRGRVWMNGVEIQDVLSVKFEAGVDNPAKVTLELYAKSVNAFALEVTSLTSDAREFKSA